MPFVTLPTHRVHYEVSGPASAPPLVLVMGLAFSLRAWDTLPEKLAASFRVVTIDNRGAGGSTLPPGLFGVSDMADDVARVLDALAIDRARVFGMSMGGMIAIELALRHRARVARLALGCTHAGYLRSKKPSFGVAAKLLAGAMSERPGDPAAAASFLVAPESYARDPGAFAAWLAKVDRAPAGVVRAQMRAVLFHAADARVSSISAPTLVLSGDRDALVPPENSVRLARAIPGARLAWLPGAGHCFAFEREPETVRALLDFFTDPAITEASDEMRA